METITRKFKALSDPGRIRILRMLEAKPLCVCEITAVLGLAVSTVSKHLSILKDAGFITDRKDQKWVEYRLIERSDQDLTTELLMVIRNEFERKGVKNKEKLTALKMDRNILCGPNKKD